MSDKNVFRHTLSIFNRKI